MLRAIIALYILAAAAMPFAHHDLACHLKSNTHCSTCHIGASADPDSNVPSLRGAGLPDAGRAVELSCQSIASPALLASAGRSPPATTL